MSRTKLAAVARRLRRDWRLGLWGAVLACFLGLVTVEACHHHDKVALEQQCVLCQAAAHQPLDVSPPSAGLTAAALVVLYFLTHWQPRVRIASARQAVYRSRAPPLAL